MLQFRHLRILKSSHCFLYRKNIIWEWVLTKHYAHKALLIKQVLNTRVEYLILFEQPLALHNHLHTHLQSIKCTISLVYKMRIKPAYAENKIAFIEFILYYSIFFFFLSKVSIADFWNFFVRKSGWNWIIWMNIAPSSVNWTSRNYLIIKIVSLKIGA